ncbi:hypothetical protein PHLGIDRAFT_32444 [Phlebiopsis gigantea 11061_1 CR5-6]|uniref:BTB domain-containing protein n=1 Tax=Phlebiopsis gigantea (strain 11061_1 CR5-6) TaxID=745531 RepID=A0A0C3RZC6_PHLG1|nr:hypothetical protein PHLGIDRAFT_32444 [Phlebiopsis gigantea 11061_1 CR5-6]
MATPEGSRSPSVELVSYIRTAPAPFNRPGDFIIRTAQDTRYHVTLAILSFASSYFRDLPDIERNEDNEVVLAVPESDAVVETLLRLIYPMPDPVFCDLDDLTDAYVAAKKYKLDSATQSLQKMLIRFVESDPLRVYALARRFDLDEEANIAARRACLSATQAWPQCEEFNHISAAQYHDLLQFHKRRGQAAAHLVKIKPLCEPCWVCGKKWSKPWKKCAARLLVEAPSSERMFTPDLLGELALDPSPEWLPYAAQGLLC